MHGSAGNRVVCLLLGGDGRRVGAKPTLASVVRTLRSRIAAVVLALAF